MHVSMAGTPAHENSLMCHWAMAACPQHAVAVEIHAALHQTFSAYSELVGTLSNGYTKSGPLPRVAPFRGPIAKLTRALTAHLSTITNAPYLGTVVGEHIT